MPEDMDFLIQSPVEEGQKRTPHFLRGCEKTRICSRGGCSALKYTTSGQSPASVGSVAPRGLILHIRDYVIKFDLDFYVFQFYSYIRLSIAFNLVFFIMI